MADFTGMVKHVGMLNNTGKNVVVVFMQLPGDPFHALVVDTDALPDAFNDSLRRIVESTEGQQAQNLADVLGRRMSPDGSNMTLLNKFHQAGRLQKVPVGLVTMTPRKGVRWPLPDVISAMDETKPSEPQGFDELDPETRAALAADLKKFNVHTSNMEGTTKSGRRDDAIGLIRQAELLESDAQNIRMRAYKIDPSLIQKNKKSQSTVSVTEKDDGGKIYAIDLGDMTPAKAKKEIKKIMKQSEIASTEAAPVPKRVGRPRKNVA
jgi:hypothetical protein